MRISDRTVMLCKRPFISDTEATSGRLSSAKLSSQPSPIRKAQVDSTNPSLRRNEPQKFMVTKANESRSVVDYKEKKTNLLLTNIVIRRKKTSLQPAWKAPR